MKCEISVCGFIYIVRQIWPYVLKSLQQSMCEFIKHLLNREIELKSERNHKSLLE